MKLGGKTFALVLGAALAIVGCGRAGSLHRSPQELAARAATTPPEIDAGRTVTQLVRAVAGGVVTAADGATLTIPPLALAVDTFITVNVPSRQTAASAVLRYAFGPEGTRFSIPATLRIPYEDLPGGVAPTIQVFHSSTLNPIVSAGGGERTNWEEAEVTDRDFKGHVASVRVEHFSFFYACVGVDRDLYVVTEIPAKYLQPGDLVFQLSQSHGDRCGTWRPGHVGLFCGNQTNAMKPVDRIIEAGGPSPDACVAESSLKTFMDENGVFLGARRVGRDSRRDPPKPLTAEEQRDAVAFAENQRGKPYCIIGTGIVTEGSYSCVGLADAALRAAGREPLSVWSTRTAATPLELFEETHPVSDFDADAGDEIVVPVKVAQADHRSPSVGTRVFGWYSEAEPYTLTTNQLPPGATFKGEDTAKGTVYTFRWTPSAADAGKSFTWEFEVRIDNPVTGYSYVNRKMEIRVRPLAKDRAESGVAAVSTASSTLDSSTVPTATPSPAPVTPVTPSAPVTPTVPITPSAPRPIVPTPIFPFPFKCPVCGQNPCVCMTGGR